MLQGRRKKRHSPCLAGLTSGEPWGSAGKSRGLGTHLKANGYEAGERKLVNVGGEGQLGPDRHFRGHRLCDAISQNMLTAWGQHREAPKYQVRHRLWHRLPHSPSAPSPRGRGSSGEPNASQGGTVGSEPPHCRQTGWGEGSRQE